MHKNGEGYRDNTAGEAIENAEKVDRRILNQLGSLKKERDDILQRIKKLDYEIDKMREEGYYASDSVACGKKGKRPLETKTVSGFPFPQYQKKLRYKELNREQLRRKEADIEKSIYLAEQYIESIPDSRARRIARYKCMDEALSWQQIAHKMGRSYTAESCRQIFERVVGVRK